MKLKEISNYRSEIYGFSIVWIMLFHAYAIDNVNYANSLHCSPLINVFMENGSVGVDVFLFLSGVCLYFSFINNQDLGRFIKKRMQRVYMPLLIINGTYWFIKYIVILHEESKFISSILTLDFWETGDQTIWFVSLIITLYFLYPYIFHFLFSDNDGKSYLIRGLILVLVCIFSIIAFKKLNTPLYNEVEIAITRIPVFIIGCTAGKPVYENKKLPKSCWALFAVGAIAFFCVLGMQILSGYKRRLFFGIGGVILAYVLSAVFKMTNKRMTVINTIFKFFGKMSLELYLSHIAINQIYKASPLYHDGDIVRYMAVLVISTIVALIAYSIEDKIIKKKKALNQQYA